MGGFHPTLCPEEAAEFADSIVIGEAEETWPELISDLKKGDLKRVYKQAGRPDFSGSHPDKTIYKGKKYLDLGLVEAGRGCRFSCEFCSVQSYFRRTYRMRQTEDVIADVKSSGKRVIFFVDDNIAASPQQAKRLLTELIPLKVRWIGQASINIAKDEEFLDLLERSGCFALLIGLETLDRESLREMNKQINSIEGGVEQALRKIQKHSIRLYPTFIFGYPEDDENTFSQALGFAKRNRFLLTAFNHLTPFPGTPLYGRLERSGELVYERWWLDPRYTYGESPVRTKHLDHKQLKALCVSTRRSFYSISSIIQRMINRVNCNSLSSLITYVTLNAMFSREIDQRTGLPLGDESFKGDLMKIERPGQSTHLNRADQSSRKTGEMT